MKPVFTFMLGAAALCVPTAYAQNYGSRVDVSPGRVVVQGDSHSVVEVNGGRVVNRAVGKGAVAETNIAGRRTVVQGDGAEIVTHTTTTTTSDRRSGKSGSYVNANLSGRNFEGQSFEGQSFVNADLSGSNLRRANLRHADLTNVDLSGADLRDADLRGAKLVNVELNGALLDGARWVDGRRCTRGSCH